MVEAINSVLAQTFQDFEIIVVDDGSADGTRETVDGIRDCRIRYFFQENAGRSAARNHGLAEARGEFVAFLDDDDAFLPHKLEVQVRELEADPEVGLVVGGWLKIVEQGNVLEEVPPKFCPLDLEAWLLDCPFIIHAPLVRREWAEKAGGFDRDFEPNEDWGFWLWLAGAGCRMRWQKEIVSCVRQHSGNSMSSYFDRIARSGPVMLDRFFASSMKLSEPIMARKNLYYARAYLTRGLLAVGIHDLVLARENMSKAFDLHPSWAGESRGEYAGMVADSIPASYDASRVLDGVLDVVPDSLRRDRSFARKLYGNHAMRIVYSAYRGRKYRMVLMALGLVAVNEPHYLPNRGVVAMLFRSVLRLLRVSIGG